MSYNSIDFFLILPESYFFLSIFILFFFNIFSLIKLKKKYINLNRPNFFILLFTIFNTIVLFCNNISINFSIFNNMFISNSLIFYFKLFILVFFFIFLIAFFDYFTKNSLNSLEFLLMLSFYIGSILLILSANDFILLYILLEINGICMFGILLVKRKNFLILENIVKYFIITSIITSLFLYSVSILYVSVGSFNFFDFEIFFWDGKAKLWDYIGLTLLIVSVILKLGVAPLHIWIFDLYKLLPYTILFYLLTFSKIILVYLLFKFYMLFYSLMVVILPFFVIIALLTSFFGILFALFQSKIKEIFIFSSISNISFFLMSLFVDGYDSFSYFLFFILVYTINILGIFIIFNIIRHNVFNKELTDISNLKNLYAINPTLAIILASFLFSLAGFPPFPGFVYKFYFLLSLIENGFFSLFFIFLILYVVSSFYYLKIIKILFVNKNNKLALTKPINKYAALILAFIFFFNIFLIFFQNDILIFLDYFISNEK